ncbi:MAG: hypothetical protein ACK5MI_04990 [Mangrovibacterium sp.]
MKSDLLKLGNDCATTEEFAIKIRDNYPQIQHLHDSFMRKQTKITASSAKFLAVITGIGLAAGIILVLIEMM